MSTFEIIVIILLSVLCVISWLSLSLKNSADNKLEGIQTTLEIFNRHNNELTHEYRSEVRLAIDELCELQKENNKST
ncbi:hypothetical protein FM038_019310 [Shewanella eurypsychrophilus]|uniref:Phage protein n=1 Tax=Shewanella eurypsychrophilus TaxID=2593656 RepID=A0ABX6V9F1_9GAMM|nr:MULTISPECIES: hypothetical protein [Shewanella]QFU24081.1 hypothetical protein FS418_21040 [Shewanella sp. YLB-09]QPG59290.1 hypothetical protein FM038_019310 [Shewanella eurypsychrophilus]